jgi:hypothetical protein
MTREEIEALEELIPLRKAGIMIGVPYETMRRYVKERKIPYYKVFGRIKVSKREIHAMYELWRVPSLKTVHRKDCAGG